MRERHVIEVKARAQRTRELVAFWNTLNFSSGEQTADEIVRRLDWSSLPLTTAQKETARRRVRETVSYLLSPTFDTYYRLKTENLHYSFHLDGRAAKIVGWTNGTPRAAPPRTAALALWEAVARERVPNQPPRLTAISLDGPGVSVSTNAPPGGVHGGKLWKSFTIAYAAPDPGFRYERPDQGNTVRPPLLLTVNLFTRSNTSTNPGPVQLSFGWSESDQTWTLSQMLTDVQLKMDTLF